MLASNSNLSRNDIWSNTVNRTEERKLIHQFWLELSKEERKSLILIEKEAVLRKIKDQQKTNCNCSVCGKTRHSVEYELEVLYDAYFKELEKYAYGQQQKQRLAQTDDEDDDEEEEGDDDTDDELSNFDLPARTVKQDMFTVSDHRVKKDGEKLLSLMHKFAEKKRQRELEVLNDTEEESDIEEDTTDQEEEEEDSDCKSDADKRQDALKMFTVFAARMFEQRVLHAYREKVAQDRQKRLIEELEEEDRKKQERELKKQKEKEEKKNKKRLLKLQQEKEREELENRKRQEELAAKLEQEKERQLREQERIRREQERQKKETERLQKETERKKKRLREKEAEKKRKEEELLSQQKKKKEKPQHTEPSFTNENESNIHHKHATHPHSVTDPSNNAADLTRQLPLAGPIGSPVTTNNIPSIQYEPNQRSFFSTHLFDQPTNKRISSYEHEHKHAIKRQSNLEWSNGWTPLNALSNNVHGKLFGDVITSRYAMIIERTRVTFKKLDEIAISHLLPKPLYYSLSQLHRAIHEVYQDDMIIGMREVYEAITKYPEHEFKCVLSEHQGYIVYYDPPITPMISNNIPI